MAGNTNKVERPSDLELGLMVAARAFRACDGANKGCTGQVFTGGGGADPDRFCKKCGKPQRLPAAVVPIRAQ